MSSDNITVSISGATIYDAAGVVNDNTFSITSVAWDAENNKFVDATITFSGEESDEAWTPGNDFSKSVAVIGGCFSKQHSYTSSSYENKSLLYYDVTVSGAQGPAVQTTGPIYIVGGTYSNLTMGGSGSSGGAAFRSRGENADVFAITQKTTVINGKEVKIGTLITGNTAKSGIGGAIHTFNPGTRWYIDGATFSYNTSGHDYVDGNTKTGGARGGGAICDQGSQCTTVKNTLFDNNYAVWRGGAVTVMNSANNFSAYNCRFIDNNAGKDGGAIYYNAGTLTVSNCYFENNNAVEKGGAIYVNGSNAQISDSVFATATDDIYNSGKVYFSGSITLNASLLGNDGIYYIADGTNFTIGGKDVSLYGLDFSNATITVDGTDLAAGDVIATNIGGLGAFDIIGNDELILSVSADNKLIVSKMAETTLSGTSVNGAGANLITGGSTDTFIANRGGAATLLTTVTGGSIDKNFIGGAFAKAEEGNVSVKNTELNIGGEADVKGQVYAGGYFYGIKDAERATEAQMIVGSVNIALDGGKVNGNLYAGIHARQNANVKVDEVIITVNGGEHDRVYAGGWAEGNAKSTVDKSTITVDGGKVNFIYGGGANGQGVTHVGATTITVGANAKVGTIFMSGRYGYSEVGTVELNWYGKADMKRLSGVSSAGIDNADSTTVNLFSDLTVDGIDFVDKFVLAEGVKLNCTGEFLLGDRINGEASGATIFDFTTDGLTEAWDAIAGISDFEHALFSVNGKDQTAWTDTNAALVINGYELSYNDTEKTVTLKQLA